MPDTFYPENWGSQTPAASQNPTLGLQELSNELVPILSTPGISAQETLSRMYKVYNNDAGKWTDEAKDKFSEIADNLRKAGNVDYRPALSGLVTEPPNPDPSKTDDDNLKAIDSWKESTVKNLQDQDEGAYYLSKGQILPLIEGKARDAKRNIEGKDIWRPRDILARTANASFATVASTFQSDDPEYYNRYLTTNPKYDDTVQDTLAKNVGSFIPAAAVAIPVGALMSPAAGFKAFEIAAAASIGGSAYNDTYNSTYAATGSSHAAHVDAIRAGLVEGGATYLIQNAIAKKVMEPWAAYTSKATQEQLLADLLDKGTIPVVAKAAGRGAIAGVPSQAVGSAVMNIDRQSIENQYTGKDLNYQTALYAGEVGAVTGFVVGGFGGALGGYFQKLSAKKQARVLTELGKKDLSLDKDGSTVTNAKGEKVGNLEELMAQDFVEVPVDKNAPPKPSQGAPETVTNAEKRKAYTEPAPGKTLSPEEVNTEVAKIQSFADDPQAKSMDSPVSADSIPEKALAAMNEGHTLEMTETPTGVTITKVPHLSDPIESTITPTETKVKVDPNSEEQARISVIPKKIMRLKAALEGIPTKEALRAKRDSLAAWIGKKEIELTRLKAGQVNPEVVAKAEENLNRERSKLSSLVKDYNFYDARVLKKALSLKNEINRLQLQYDVATDFVKQSGTPEGTTFFSRAKKGIIEEAPTIEGTADALKPALKSQSTGATFTPRIEAPLRNVMNFWLGSTKITNAHVTTFDEANSHVYDNVMDPEHRVLLDKILKDIKEEGASGAKKLSNWSKDGAYRTNKEGTHSVIVLKDGRGNNVDSFIPASHEFGHAYWERKWNQFPVTVKEDVLRDFLKQRDAANRIKGRGTVAQVGDLLFGAQKSSNSPFIGEMPFKDVDFEVKKYLSLTGKEGIPSLRSKSAETWISEKADSKSFPFEIPGLHEFVANKIARELHRQGVVSNSGSQALYGALAQEMTSRWKAVAERFPDTPSLTSFFGENFDDFRGALMLKQGPKAPKNPEERDKRISEGWKRALENSKLEPNSNKISKELLATPAEYEITHDTEALRAAQDAIAKDGPQETLLKVLEGRVPEKEWDHYAVMLERVLESQLSTSKDPDVLDFAKEGQYLLQKKRLDQANVSGARTRAQYLWAKYTKTGLVDHIAGQMFEYYRQGGLAAPGEFRKMIDDVVTRYYLEYDQARGSIKNSILRQIGEELYAASGKPTTPGVFWATWYGNVLSGLGTQWINFRFGSQDLIGTTLADMLSNPGKIPGILSALGRGFKGGLIEAQAALANKAVTFRGRGEMDLTRPDPRVNWDGTILAPLAKIVNLQFRLQKYFPFQALGSVEKLISRMSSEVRAHIVAAENLKKELGTAYDKISSGEFADALGKKLYNTESAWKEAKDQAKAEWQKYGKKFRPTELVEGKAPSEPLAPGEFIGFTKNGKKVVFKHGTEYNVNPEPSSLDINLRALEIIDEKRQAADPTVYEEAKRAGQYSIYANKPEGTFGAIYEAFQKLMWKVPESRFGFPFPTVACNLISRLLDYTPVGVARGLLKRNLRNPRMADVKTGEVDAKGNPVYEKRVVPFSDVEAHERLAKGLMGMTALGLFAAGVASGKYKVYGYGPKSKGERDTWLTQHTPYSVEGDGKFWFKYSETPLGLMLGWLGALEDARTWDKGFRRDSLPEQVGLSGVFAMRTLMDMGPLKALDDLLSVMKGDKSPSYMVANIAKGFVPYSSLGRDLDKIFEPNQVDPKTIKGVLLSGIPFAQGFAEPKLNRFGEPIPKTARFFFSPLKDKVWEYLAGNNLHVASLPGAIVIGQGLSESVPTSVMKNREALLGRAAYNVFTEDEARRLAEISGPKIKRRIEREIMHQVVTDKNREEIQKEIDSIVNDETNQAKIKVMLSKKV